MIIAAMTPRQIKQIRTKLGLTQEEFAELVGVSQEAVSQWESGMTKPDKRSTKIIKLVKEKK